MSRRSTAISSRSTRPTARSPGASRSCPTSNNYTITGAPRVAARQGVHRQRAAPNTRRAASSPPTTGQTGKKLWRFHTVPGNPADGFENDAMKTRRQDLGRRVVEARRRRHGVGCDHLRSDDQPGAVRHRQCRAVEPGGERPARHGETGEDNLYTSSIVAVDADTGEYAWHFQETPGGPLGLRSATRRSRSPT